MLGMWEGRALSMDVSQKGSVPRTGKGTAKEVSVPGVQEKEPCCKELQQLLEMKRMRDEEKVEGITVKALLDSGVMSMFVDRKFTEKYGFRMEKVDRPSKVTNIDGTDNIGRSIMHEIECNIYYRGHVERMRMDVCNLGQI